MERFTPREVQLMNVLWDRGPSTVAEIKDALDDGSAYTTILTLMRLLEEKGHVTRSIEGRAHRYCAAVEREEARANAVHRVIGDFFRGSADALLTQLVSDHEMDDATLRHLRSMLNERIERTEDAE